MTLGPVLLPWEVAELLRVSESSVRAWTRDGRLKRVPNVGRRVLILTASVEEMVGGPLYDGDDGPARRRHDHREAGRAAPGGGDDARPATRVRVRPEVPRPARPQSG